MVKTLALFLALLAAGRTEAGPLDWVRHHKRFLFMEGAAVTGAVLHYKGLSNCRKRNGPEPCDEHYGAAWANFGIVTAINTIVLPSAAEGCWKGDGGKFCNILAYGGSAAQAGWGIREWRIHEKKTAVR